MPLKGEIFRDYDIRGIYPSELDEHGSYVIGQALGTFLNHRKIEDIVVGRDNRASSLFLTENFIKGVLSTGINVTYVGITLTPVIHFLTCGDTFGFGVTVTASHNPQEYNGFRFDYQGALPCYGADIQKIYDIASKKTFSTGTGNYVEKDLSAQYIRFMRDSFSFNSDLNVVIDCGNGASSQIAPEIFNNCGLTITPVYCTFDSTFPHHIPDPEDPVFLKQLKKKVLDSHADLGIGFDTDGDRVGFVDEKGNAYTSDELLMLFAKDVLTKKPHSNVVFDVKSTEVLFDVVKQYGGTAKQLKTGHPYFLTELIHGNASIGAEYSGHIYFADDYFGYDDGVYAACRLLKILTTAGKKLSVLMEQFPKRESSPEVKVACSDSRKFKIMHDIKAQIAKDLDIISVSNIDGVRAKVSPTGWFLIRASNTSPYLSVRIEAINAHEKALITKKVSSILSNNGLTF